VNSATQLNSFGSQDRRAGSAVTATRNRHILAHQYVRPQVNEVGFQLTEYFGIAPAILPPKSTEDVLDASVLRLRRSLPYLYRVRDAPQGRDENHWKKSLHYQKLLPRQGDDAG